MNKVRPSPLAITLRDATDTDLAFIRKMLYEASNRPGTEWPPFEDSMNEDWNRRFWCDWMRPGDLGVIADVEGAPVGAAWIRPLRGDELSPIDRADIPVLAIGIEPGFRGRGIGGQLMAALLVRAVAAGVRAVSLTTGLFNEPAVRLYARFGFVETLRRGDAIQMRLTLTPQREA